MLRLDRLLIPWLASNSQLGLYIIVATMTELLCWPVQHYVDSHVPKWRNEHRAGLLSVSRVTLRSVAYVAVAAAATAVPVWLLIVPLFGTEYVGARSLVVPLIIAACCYGVSRVSVGLCLATGRVRSPMFSDGAGALVMLVLCLTLIPGQGAMGAALASLAGYFTAAAISIALSTGRWSKPRDRQRHASKNRRVAVSRLNGML